MLIICVTSTMLISVYHCLRLMILFIVNLETFVVCDVLVSLILLFDMIRFFNLVFILPVYVSILYCLSL